MSRGNFFKGRKLYRIYRLFVVFFLEVVVEVLVVFEMLVNVKDIRKFEIY